MDSKGDIDGLEQERCNSNALAMELRLSCINPERRNSSAIATELRFSCTNPERRYSSALAMELCLSCTHRYGYETVGSHWPVHVQRLVQHRMSDFSIFLWQVHTLKLYAHRLEKLNVYSNQNDK